jgi:hypothetical protein
MLGEKFLLRGLSYRQGGGLLISDGTLADENFRNLKIGVEDLSQRVTIPATMPEILEQRTKDILKQYFQQLKGLPNESAKRSRFAALIQERRSLESVPMYNSAEQ